jgi:putative PIN family toxin of toxin-antitoxin system
MKPRVVLDTNILLDLFYFEDIRVQALHDSLKKQKIIAYTCEAIWQEFEEVLQRPTFNQSPAEITILRKENSAYFEWFSPEKNSSGIKCVDPDDQIFIELSVEIAPCLLITKDKDLLRLKKRLEKFQVQTLREFPLE